MTRLSAEALVAGHRDGRRRIPIVGPVDLTVEAGRLTVVMGPNGAGKTTLLRALSGVTAPLAGRVLIGDTPLGDLRRGQRARTIAVVLTDHPDVGLLKVRDVVGIGRHPHTGWAGRMDAYDHDVVADTMAAVGVTHLADRHLGRLSDGQRQRVWIARALAQEPEVLLLDEPTAFLDLPGRVETVALLRRLAVERDLAVVASIHDLDLALRIADHVWLLGADGALTAGAPEDLALSGAIDVAFGRDDVRFDLTTASFSTPVDCCAEVGLTGLDADPVRRLWTERALTRAGALLVDGPAWLTVSGTAEGWAVTGPDGVVAIASLDELVRTIRDATAGVAADDMAGDGVGGR
ncbi:MAG TPA: ABC transporter ATP-binding protein [Euzebya sp.]|nr:ABC transporter ATP-binding protein [Euzebya sp.]